MNRTCTLLLVVCMAVSAAVAQPTATDVPVTRVALFSSGVGYFEHTGTVEGDAVTQLMFKTVQINDVLKSMIVTDMSDTGGVTSVNYASREPLLRALQSFAVDLSDQPDLAELFNQLRGAEVTVSAPNEITGTILGVEQRQRVLFADGSSTLIFENILDLVTDDGIKALPMDTIQNFVLTDQRLADELNKALAVLLASRDTERKPVDIHFAGEGRREVRIGYVTETPIWKTSYRLDLTGEMPRIQGWAIIENTSDVDWTGVQLSLVSGRPISFVQDLYTPLYLPRPVVEPELYASLRPQTYAEGMFASDDESEMPAARAMGRARGGEMAMQPPMAMADSSAFMEDAEVREALDLGGRLSSVAQAGEVGELFLYDLPQPVDLPRRTSAMLPLLDEEIDAEQVSIYNASVMPRHPLNGAILMNDTGMTLLGGPITVLDEGMYAGDASIGHLADGDSRLISYAVDLKVLIDSTAESTSDITAVKIVRGTLIVTRKSVTTQEYAIANEDDDERIIIIEHPYDPSQELVEPLATSDLFEERTDRWYRFRKVVAADSEATLKVVTQRVFHQSFSILNYDLSSLVWYSNNTGIDEDIRSALIKAIQLRQELAALQQHLTELEQENREIETGQERLRRNIETAGRDSTLGQRYLTKLNDEEDRIEQLQEQIESTREAITAAQQALVDYLNDLSID